MKAYLILKNNVFIYHYCKSNIFPFNKSINCFLGVTFFGQLQSKCFKSEFRTSDLNRLNRTHINRSFPKNIMNPCQEQFSISDYNCIGFDLDNTLCEYKIDSLIQMEYEVLSKYLVEQKGYDANYLYEPLDSDAVDFFQRGLILDLRKGNILKLDENGVIVKASHGTKFLTETNIKVAYGDSRTCELSEHIFSNLTIAWQEPMKRKYRLLLDYFDLPASLGFARAVDSKEAKGEINYEVVGSDVLSALVYMYSRDHFKTEESEFFRRIKRNPEKYINKCSEKVINWLKELRKTRRIFLITGSNIDNASFTASNCLGNDWKHLFDIVVCYARKPGFFEMERPYLSVCGLNEGTVLKNHSIKLGNAYSQGNWKDLYSVLCSNSSCNAKCLYIGDNFVEDIYTPQRNSLCDTVAVSEELYAEGFYETIDHPSGSFIRSEKWGSCFFVKDTERLTLWGSIIDKHAKLCIPSLNYFSSCLSNHNICLNTNLKFVNKLINHTASV